MTLAEAPPYDGMNGGAEPPNRLASHVLNALRRRCLLIVLLGSLLGTAAAAAVYLNLEDSYTARAMIHIPISRQRIAFDPVGMNSSANFKVFVNTQRRLITSPQVLNAALASEEVRKVRGVIDDVDPLQWLSQRLATTFSDESEIMEVRLTTEDREAATTLLDAVVEAYIMLVQGREETDRESRLANLEQSYTQAQQALRRTKERLAQERMAEGGVLTEKESMERQAAMERWAALKPKLFEIDFQLAQLRKNEQADRESGGEEAAAAVEENGDGGSTDASADDAPAPVQDEQLDAAVLKDPLSVQIVREMERAEEKIRRADEIFQEGSPRKIEYVRLQQDVLETSRERLAERREGLKEELQNARFRSSEMGGDYPLTIGELESQRAAVVAELNQLEANMQNNSVGGSFVERELIEAESRAQENVLDWLAQQIEETEVEMQSPPRIYREGDTMAPSRADKRPRMMKAGAAGGFAFAAMAGVIVLFDLRRRRVSCVDDISDEVRLEVIGTLPMLRRLRRNQQRQNQELLEAVDGVAAALLCGPIQAGTQVIMVSSAVAGEGKTTLAANLANALAGAGRQTLLMDFDLRRPMLQTVYGLELGPGVSDALSGRENALTVCQPTDDPLLSVMTAGQGGERTLSKLSHPAVREMFEALRSKYDFIIVDTSPVLMSVDARLVGKHTDGAILSLLRDVSEIKKVTAARRILDSYSVPVLGGVMIGTSAEVYYGSRRASNKEPQTA